MGKPLSAKHVNARKRKAEEAIRRKVQEGYKFDGMEDVERILKQDCDDFGEEDFYDCLSTKDLANLLIIFVNEGVHPAEPPPVQKPVPVAVEQGINDRHSDSDCRHRSDSGIGSSVESGHSDKDCEDQSDSGIHEDQVRSAAIKLQIRIANSVNC